MTNLLASFLATLTGTAVIASPVLLLAAVSMVDAIRDRLSR